MRLKFTLMIQLPIPVPLPFPLSTPITRYLNKKCHLLLSFKTPQVVSTSGKTITSCTAETLLGIIIDSELKFENHLNFTCNKVSLKINALGRVTNNWVPLRKRRILMKIFTESQFNCYPLYGW